MLEMIRKCTVLTPDASERSTAIREARLWPFRVIQSCSMEINV